MIREAIDDDAAALADIYNYYIQHTVITFEEVPVTADEFRERIKNILASGHAWLVALEHDRIIGYAYSHQWSERAAYKYAAEISVYLAHDTLTRGWGTRLYEALFAQMRERAVHTAIGGIALPNPASVALHEKFGMEKVAQFTEVGFKFGEWIDVGYWQVRLRP